MSVVDAQRREVSEHVAFNEAIGRAGGRLFVFPELQVSAPRQHLYDAAEFGLRWRVAMRARRALERYRPPGAGYNRHDEYAHRRSGPSFPWRSSLFGDGPIADRARPTGYRSGLSRCPGATPDVARTLDCVPAFSCPVYGRDYAGPGEFGARVDQTSRELTRALKRLDSWPDLLILPCCDQCWQPPWHAR